MYCNALTGLVSVLLAVSGGSTVTVTETEFLSRLDKDPAVVVRSSQLSIARAELLEARTLENPVFEYSREDPDGAVSQDDWLLSWQLPGPTRRLEIDAAGKSVEATAARVEHQLRMLRTSARQDFAAWAVAAKRRDLLAASVDRLDKLAAREAVRAEKGESSGLGAHRLRLAADALESQLSLAAAEQQRARAAVARWWPELSPEAQPELPALPTAATSEGPSEAEHPLISANRAQAESAELSRRASERLFGAPALSIGWQQQNSPAGEISGPVLGLAWTVPLFDRRRAERQAAEARAQAARAEVELATRHIRSRRAATQQRFEDLAREATEAKTRLEPSTGMLVAAETSFRYGELPLTDLLDILRSVSDAQLAWLSLHAAALEAHRELEALTTPMNTASSTPSTESH